MTVRDIVYVVTDPGVPAFGRKGASSHVRSVLRELTTRARRAGGSVTLVATRIGGDVPEGLEDVRTVELGRPRATDPAQRERLLVDLDARAADAVAHALARHRDPARTLVYQRHSLWSALVMERAREAGARTVLEVNAPLVEEQAAHRVLVDRARALDLTVRSLRAAHLCYAVSTAVAEWAERTAGLAPGTVPAVPNGVDLALFSRAVDLRAARTRADRTHADRPHDVPTVAFVSTFRPWHGPDMLVDAAALLRERGTPVRLLLVGEGPQLEDTLRRAERAGVEVESHGAVDPERVPELLARADLAAAPYPAGDSYFSPLKVAEYLAAGLPTVASAVGDLPHLVRHPEVALVPPGDLDGFTDALGRLVADPDARCEAASAGLATAHERLSWTAVLDRVLDDLDTRTRGEAA